MGECPYDRQIKRQIDLRYSGSLQEQKTLNSEKWTFLQKKIHFPGMYGGPRQSVCTY